jgi:hypothetical protein
MKAMRVRITAIFFWLATAAWIVAAQGSPYEQALQQGVDGLEKIGTTLKTIVDEESAAAAKPALRKSADAFVESKAKAAKLPPPEKEEKARLEKQFKPKFDEAIKKMNTEIRRVESIPGGKEALKEIAHALKKDDKK